MVRAAMALVCVGVLVGLAFAGIQSQRSPAGTSHSGNAFRYAEEDGYLGKYFIVGLHENYITQNVLIDIHNNPFLDYISYEEIFIHERKKSEKCILLLGPIVRVAIEIK